MVHRIEVVAEETSGLKCPVRVYNIKDELQPDELTMVAALLADPVVEKVAIDSPVLQPPENSIVIEVTPKPGVTDPVGEETRKVLERVLGKNVGPVSFSEQFMFHEDASAEKVEQIKKQLVIL